MSASLLPLVQASYCISSKSPKLASSTLNFSFGSANAFSIWCSPKGQKDRRPISVSPSLKG